jgi:hypothetical protein
MDRVMALRADLLACSSCSFESAVTADYGDAIHEFRIRSEGRSDGTLGFEVLEPESIAGITGKFSGGKGALTFDDTVLYLPALAEGQVAPVSGPWILFKTLLGGYLKDCVMEDELLHVCIADSYEENALILDIWLDEDNKPVQAEIFYEGCRIITMQIEKFQIL